MLVFGFSAISDACIVCSTELCLKIQLKDANLAHHFWLYIACQPAVFEGNLKLCHIPLVLAV